MCNVTLNVAKTSRIDEVYVMMYVVDASQINSRHPHMCLHSLSVIL